MSNLAVAQGIIVLIGVLVYALFFRKKTEALPPLPPGPAPLPILGNIKDAPPPGKPEYEHWNTFKDRYGPISSVTTLGQTIVLLFDEDVVTEVLEKGSVKTAGRPMMPFAAMCGHDRFFALLQYADRFRLYRKVVHQQLGTKQLAAQYADIQDVESKRFLWRVLRDPDHLFQHIKTEAAAIILKITYGYTIELEKPDPLVGLIERVMAGFSDAVVPFSWAVDIIPALAYLPDWFPGAGFKRIAREQRAIMDASADIPYNFVLKQMSNGTNQESFVSRLVTAYRNEGKPADDMIFDHIKWVAQNVYAGGADTTVSSLTSFILGMVLHPDVQQKAQEEIDRVVGLDRLPSDSDRENLPYVDGVAIEDMVVRGYRIPKGAYLLPAIWWLLHDPERYPEPMRFAPERYMEPRNEPDPACHAFGYGRRVCPGRFLAQDNLFTTIARTLAVFTIGKAVRDGRPVDVEWKHTPGLIDHPVEFPYSIVPRSEKHAEMIRRVEVEHPWKGSSIAEALQGVQTV
ncbi:cytochrome P450 [Trichoderma citrinoviride]|uniref:Cytochrome P450 n=1 Tax=Trichoderma citrinoviride TaxID=58853 RepID=A0A2T4B0Y3_9HYPO|nr:cytochrome P450 [Trichoderma citrinoviride]PTB62982.1 cytochrome P450 [Trichoderma citrinoviride]